jgi:hypothetical protein
MGLGGGGEEKSIYRINYVENILKSKYLSLCKNNNEKSISINDLKAEINNQNDKIFRGSSRGIFLFRTLNSCSL